MFSLLSYSLAPSLVYKLRYFLFLLIIELKSNLSLSKFNLISNILESNIRTYYILIRSKV